MTKARVSPGGKEQIMKYFISQAMNGRTDEAIKAERAKVIAAMNKENPDRKNVACDVRQ